MVRHALPAAPKLRASVLVIDDHPVVIDGVRQLLAREPDLCLVGHATDGEEGVHAAKQLTPDIVVLDLKLGDNFAPFLCGALLEASPGSRVVITRRLTTGSLCEHASTPVPSGLCSRMRAISLMP